MVECTSTLSVLSSSVKASKTIVNIGEINVYSDSGDVPLTGSIILIPSYHGAMEAEIEGEVSIMIYFYYVISVYLRRWKNLPYLK